MLHEQCASLEKINTLGIISLNSQQKEVIFGGLE
jgi:hypothetical protein